MIWSIIFFIGLGLAIFSHPKVSRFFMSRFFNEGVLTPKKIKPEKAELIRFAGPNLSIFAAGLTLMLLGIILKAA